MTGIGFGRAGVLGVGYRGGEFEPTEAGNAQIRLVPSPDKTTHPESGEAGDMYVDSANRLWFCRGDTTWVRIA